MSSLNGFDSRLKVHHNAVIDDKGTGGALNFDATFHAYAEEETVFDPRAGARRGGSDCETTAATARTTTSFTTEMESPTTFAASLAASLASSAIGTAAILSIPTLTATATAFAAAVAAAARLLQRIADGDGHPS